MPHVPSKSRENEWDAYRQFYPPDTVHTYVLYDDSKTPVSHRFLNLANSARVFNIPAAQIDDWIMHLCWNNITHCYAYPFVAIGRRKMVYERRLHFLMICAREKTSISSDFLSLPASVVIDYIQKPSSFSTLFCSKIIHLLGYSNRHSLQPQIIMTPFSKLPIDFHFLDRHR
jgi:hypothetical protein